MEIHLRESLQWQIYLLILMNYHSYICFNTLMVNQRVQNLWEVQLVKSWKAVNSVQWLASRIFDWQILTADRSILSKDQKYPLTISMTIKSRNCKDNLTVRDSGCYSHSRLLTTANRILRLYLREESTTVELQERVVFILKCVRM